VTVNRKSRSVLKIIILIALLLLFAALQYSFNVAQYLQPEAVKINLGRMGIWALFAYMVIMALIVVTPLPSLPLNIAAGTYFGPVLGTLYSVTGATLFAPQVLDHDGDSAGDSQDSQEKRSLPFRHER